MDIQVHKQYKPLYSEIFENYRRSVIRKQLHRCIPCFRSLPWAPQPLMGDLPQRPFGKGVDFAGPLDVIAALLRRLRDH